MHGRPPSALGSSSAAPTPWTSRAVLSIGIEVDTAQTAEDAVKTSRPATKAPTAEELAALRGVVREKMLIASPAYAAWARSTLVAPQAA